MVSQLLHLVELVKLRLHQILIKPSNLMVRWYRIR
jgi:hypothetical protein